MALAADSLLYRRPEFYDELCSPDTVTIDALVRTHGRPDPFSVLDIGCGTGKLLAALPPPYQRRVGVDIQPAMIRYARHAYPAVDLRVDDVRTLDLGETFDAVLCVGLTLSYLHTIDDLTAAMTAIAAHAHSGSVVILQTLAAPPSGNGATATTIELGGIQMRVRIAYDWCDPFVTTNRIWTFPDGRREIDTIRRRVWPLDTQKTALEEAGLHNARTAGRYVIANPGSVSAAQ